jgi:hypothetical protein
MGVGEAAYESRPRRSAALRHAGQILFLAKGRAERQVSLRAERYDAKQFSAGDRPTPSLVLEDR